jgi:hypothetical protein
MKIKVQLLFHSANTLENKYKHARLCDHALMTMLIGIKTHLRHVLHTSLVGKSNLAIYRATRSNSE